MRESRIVVAILVATSFIVTDLARANVIRRVRRQSDDGNPAVIDHIFNIPIAAIKGTMTAAQGFYPEYSDNISNVFQVPISALEAVGTLVKSTRRTQEDVETAMRRRKDKRERLIAQRTRERYSRLLGHHLEPITELLDQKWNGKIQFISSLVGHGGGSTQGSQGGSASASASAGDYDPVDETEDNAYEVTEEVDENRSGLDNWFGLSNIFGGTASSENKRSDRRKYSRYQEQDAPLEDKIAPKKDRINYRRQYVREPQLQDKIAPKYDRRDHKRARSRIPFDD